MGNNSAKPPGRLGHKPVQDLLSHGRPRTNFPRIFRSGKLAGKALWRVRGHPPEFGGALGLRFARENSG
jgi:hypothetical protein